MTMAPALERPAMGEGLPGAIDMSSGFWPYTVTLWAAAGLSLLMAYTAWRRRRQQSSAIPAFVALTVCTALYAFGYAFELASSTLAHMLVWNKVQFLGVAFIPALWILFAARYTGRDAWLSRLAVAVLFLLSSITLALDITNASHHWLYKSMGIDFAGAFPVIVLVRGPWHWVHLAYANLSLLAGNALLIGMFIRSPRAHRRQTAVILAGSLIPWLGLIVYLLGLTPRHIDSTPFAFALVSPVIAWALIYFRVFDIVSVAKESALASMEEGVIILDLGDRVVDFNRAAGRIFPTLGKQTLGRTLDKATPAWPELKDLVGPAGKIEVDIRSGSETEPLFYRAKMTLVTDRRGKGIGRLLLLSDTTQQTLLMEKLQGLATTDSLTGDLNRRHFLELGAREVARAKRYGHPLSAAIIDLDHFKWVNDTWGHEAGDRVLKAVSRTLTSSLRESDLIARLGGDEFAVLLLETTLRDACLAAERVRREIAVQPMKAGNQEEAGLTVSIGLAGLAGGAEETIDGLVRNADLAMYTAKKAGGNCVRWGDD